MTPRPDSSLPAAPSTARISPHEEWEVRPVRAGDSVGRAKLPSSSRSGLLSSPHARLERGTHEQRSDSLLRSPRRHYPPRIAPKFVHVRSRMEPCFGSNLSLPLKQAPLQVSTSGRRSRSTSSTPYQRSRSASWSATPFRTSTVAGRRAGDQRLQPLAFQVAPAVPIRLPTLLSFGVSRPLPVVARSVSESGSPPHGF